MNTSSLITVIVPIFKVEKYLNKCIESIVNQTYTNLEIILVDDGSPDNCPAMCDEWSERDTRIKVIHKHNGGLSDARNSGMTIATGEYIAFVDSDDLIHEKYFEVLITAIKENNADISACDIDFVNEADDVSLTASLPSEFSIYNSEQALETLIKGCGFRAIACNKLFCAKLLFEERFIEERYHEDEFFTYRILAKAQKLVYINSKMYYYLQRENSIVNSVSVKHLDALDAYIERLDYFKSNFPNLYKADKPSVCKACVNLYISIADFPSDIKKTCARRIKDNRSRIKFTPKEMISYSFKDSIYIIFSSRYLISVFCKLLLIKGNV